LDVNGDLIGYLTFSTSNSEFTITPDIADAQEVGYSSSKCTKGKPSKCNFYLLNPTLEYPVLGATTQFTGSDDDMSTDTDNYAFLEALRVTGGPSSTGGPLYIEMRGRQIPQKALFDLKTRAKDTHRPIDMNEVYRRLWVNQTPYFMFAEHFRGSFEPQDIQPIPISDGISKWEKDCKALLKHYQAIMMEIIAATRSSATGKLQVIRRGSGPLEIQERVAGDNADVLPHDLRSKW